MDFEFRKASKCHEVSKFSGALEIRQADRETLKTASLSLMGGTLAGGLNPMSQALRWEGIGKAVEEGTLGSSLSRDPTLLAAPV